MRSNIFSFQCLWTVLILLPTSSKVLEEEGNSCVPFNSCASCVGARYHGSVHEHEQNEHFGKGFELRQLNHHEKCKWCPRDETCSFFESSSTSCDGDGSFALDDEKNVSRFIVHEYSCPLVPSYPSTPPDFLPNWMGTLLKNSTSFSSLSLGDLSLPGTHDSISYDLSLTISKDGIDDHEALSKVLRKFSMLYPGEIEEFIRLQAKSQQLDIRQQLDNGIRFIDFRLMFERDGEDVTQDKWYCIHCSQSNLLSIQYLQTVYDWLEVHPHEIVVIWLSRRGSTDDIGDDAYPDVPIEDKQHFWKRYTELFDKVLFDTRQSNYLTTPLDTLIKKNHRLVTFVSDYMNFTNNSHLAYDARGIDNYFHEDGVFDEEITIRRQRHYFQNLNNRRLSGDTKWFDLMSMNTPCPPWQINAAASRRFSPFDGNLKNGKWFKSCASKTKIPGNLFCPETLLDIAQLTNYYNQITLEEAYLTYADEEGNRHLFPNAFYIDGIDFGGTIRTGTQLLMGTDHKNALEEHKFSAYAFTDTVIAYNINTACKKSAMEVGEEISRTDASCSNLLSFIESRRGAHPFELWNEPYYGRLEGWPTLTLDLEERISFNK